jgi:fermentation-respiration switch protein FrsA (DUF1100 family)
MMWALQRHIIFMPMQSIGEPVQYGLADFSVSALTSPDGVSVQSWYHKANSGFPTLLYFHGNGGNLAHRAHYFRLLADAGFGVLALDYRGYGKSGGSPSEQGFYMDARTMIQYGLKKLHIHPDRMIVYGESIGTGVAVQMATEFRFAAMVLQSPFRSLLELGQASYPWLPVGLLQIDRFDSLSKMDRVIAPVLVLHGEKDAIVPFDHGKSMYESVVGEKQSVFFPDKGHSNLDIGLLTNALVEFCKKNQLIMQ